jgi:hypothetical protein
MSVVNLDDYRAPPTDLGPFTVTFTGFPFRTPEGREDRLTVNITLQHGTPDEVISIVKEMGGIYLSPQNEGDPFWFLPWPCAAVRISVANP